MEYQHFVFRGGMKSNSKLVRLRKIFWKIVPIEKNEKEKEMK